MNRYSFDEQTHTHRLDGKPLYGTTTALSIIAKPLTWWASGLAVKELSGIDDPKIFTRIKNKKATHDEIQNLQATISKWFDEHREDTVDDYIHLLDKAYRAHSVKLDTTAQAGTDLHAELERYVKDWMAGKISSMASATNYDMRIHPFIEWSIANVKQFLWSEGYCYSEPNWFGGISDVGALLKNDQTTIIDFKSAKGAYPTHFYQAGGYDIAISENGILDKDGNLLYKPEKSFDKYLVVPFGAKEVKPIENAINTDNCKKAFLASLALYKINSLFQDSM